LSYHAQTGAADTKTFPTCRDRSLGNSLAKPNYAAFARDGKAVALPATRPRTALMTAFSNNEIEKSCARAWLRISDDGRLGEPSLPFKLKQ
jgi:hypothetical protein